MNRVVIIFTSLLCVFLCCCTSCIAVVFQDCGSTLGRFTEVSVSSCQLSDARCALTRGTNASIFVKFIPNADISQVNVHVHGVILDLPVPFPIDKPDACKDPDCGVQCPLHKDQEYHYTTTIFVQRKFPRVNVDIKWEFADDKGNEIVCILFPAKVEW